MEPIDEVVPKDISGVLLCASMVAAASNQFMHPHLYHGSGPNTSPTASRKTLLTGFCAFGANHMAYPGAYVNTRLTLREDGSIVITPAPWSQSLFVGPGVGH